MIWPNFDRLIMTKFIKLIMTKSNFKAVRYDVISVTSCYYVTEKNVTKLTSQDFLILVPSQSKFLAKPVV